MNNVNLSNFHYTETSNTKKDKSNSYRLLVILAIFGVALISITFFINRFISSSESDSVSTNQASNSNNLNDANAYFIPPSDANSKISEHGRILNAVPINVNGREISHKLVNKSNDTIAYLYSDVNDLSLSMGFDVEVVGISEKKQYNGVRIVKVESIKLK